LYLNISNKVHFCEFLQIAYRNSCRAVAFRPESDLRFGLLDVSFNVLSAQRDGTPHLTAPFSRMRIPTIAAIDSD